METQKSKNSRNVLHGNILQDIFQSGACGIDAIEKFIKALKDAFEIIHFTSYITGKYYAEITKWNTKSCLRISLIFLAYCVFIHLAEAGLLTPSPSEFSMHVLILIILFYLGVYMATFRDLSHTTYVNISLILCLVNIVFMCWARCVMTRRNSSLYTPYIVFILIVNQLLPIQLDLSITITLMMFFFVLTLRIFHSMTTDYLRKPYETDHDDLLPWYYFDKFRLHRFTKRREPTNMVLILNDSSWLVMLIISLYLKFWNQLRRKFVFYKLGKSVQARDECNASLKTKIHWIRAIMPAQVTNEYQKLQRQNLDSGNAMWVYNKPFDPVSILFADIVGFTKMSSNKTAYQVVTMLNDLFSRFDELCTLTHCEKIGTLGDCYYCVAGCPEPRDDHAFLCVEMGLGMCRIIKVFNCDHNESVNMRVGVHSGRVNAAIIGLQRFRYDVYSYDVLIANAMESSGRPGRVHISEMTYEYIKNFYNVSQGEDLLVKQEEISGIAGMVLTMKTIKTYFVDPRSSSLRKKHESFGSEQILRALNTSDDETDDIYIADLQADEMAKDGHQKAAKWEGMHINWREITETPKTAEELYDQDIVNMNNLIRNIELVNSLQTDPEKQYFLFKSPPVQRFSLRFEDPETEWHYQIHTRHYMVPTFIDSLKIAPLADAFILIFLNVIFITINMSALLQLGAISSYFIIMSGIALVIGSFCISLLIFQSTYYEDQLKSKKMKFIYRVCSHSVGRELLIGISSLIPTVILLIVILSPSETNSVYHKFTLISKLEGLCVLLHCCCISSSHFYRCLFSLISLISIRTTIHLTKDSSEKLLCISSLAVEMGFPIGSIQELTVLEICCCFVLVYFVARQNEYNCRLCFYVSREAEITCDLAELAAEEAQELLYNIIPKYVFNELQAYGEGDQTSFSYAVQLQNVGVVFACIANFFSKYYREDYKGGEAALRLLNSIICSFDQLLERKDMKDVEKVKTINDCYMVAAGLNRIEISRNVDRRAHLLALMEYCHLIRDKLEELNDMYIVGSDKFVVKIGYNFGPVTAGIIGTTKPLYDIWGDTVNVASRMYSTGLPNQVQVPKYVSEELNEHYNFHYRAEVFVKGKGNMDTYICTRKREKFDPS